MVGEGQFLWDRFFNYAAFGVRSVQIYISVSLRWQSWIWSLASRKRPLWGLATLCKFLGPPDKSAFKGALEPPDVFKDPVPWISKHLVAKKAFTHLHLYLGIKFEMKFLAAFMTAIGPPSFSWEFFRIGCGRCQRNASQRMLGREVSPGWQFWLAFESAIFRAFLRFYFDVGCVVWLDVFWYHLSLGSFPKLCCNIRCHCPIVTPRYFCLWGFRGLRISVYKNSGCAILSFDVCETIDLCSLVLQPSFQYNLSIE